MKVEGWVSTDLLGVLKDFQRRTAEYAFRRMYLDDPPAPRFLIADEVGLGKTLVARGVIAKVIEHLADKRESINIVYVCSNQDIARQNIRRLGLDGSTQMTASRITLVPLEQSIDDALGGVKLVAFTPSTSFDIKSKTGLSKERAFLAHLLLRSWNGAYSRTAVLNVLHATKGRDGFEDEFKSIAPQVEGIEATFVDAFADAISKTNLRGDFEKVAAQFKRRRRNERTPVELRTLRDRLIGDLRALLARLALDGLKPDLIILDEF